MKKTTWIKILEIAIQVVPISIYVIFNCDTFIKSVDQTIGLVALVFLITLFLIFKDGVRRFYQTPGAFKFALTVFIFSGLGLLLGETLFALSVVELMSILLAIPVKIWYNYLTRPATSQDMLSVLEKIMSDKKESKENEEHSNEIH